MGINVFLEGETGERLRELLDPQSLTNVILAIAAEDTICLGAIDWYGLTIFNRLQIPKLTAELEKARSLITETSVAEHHRYQRSRAEEVNSPPGLITILEQYARIRTYKAVLGHFESILEIARAAPTQPHQYLRFVGD